jgi:hypothetical protein
MTTADDNTPTDDESPSPRKSRRRTLKWNSHYKTASMGLRSPLENVAEEGAPPPQQQQQLPTGMMMELSFLLVCINFSFNNNIGTMVVLRGSNPTNVSPRLKFS